MADPNTNAANGTEAAKATPGPWKVNRWSNGDRGVTWLGERNGIGQFTGDAVNGVHFHVVAAKEHLPTSRTFGSFEGCHVCTVDVACGDEGEGEAKANARLIAAAPDLLAACKPVLAEAKERADYLHDTWNPDAHVELTLTIAELRAIHAAISKATGTTTK